MIYCAKCGAQLPDDAAFCPSCGAQVVRPETMGQQTNQQQNYQQNYSNGYNQGYGQSSVNYNNLAADASANKVFGILAYIGILVLVSIFAAPKESKYSRFHANQGLVLLITDVALGIACSIISAILTAIAFASFALAGLFAILASILWIAYVIFILVLIIMGIVNAANGELKQLPIIGKFTILK
jgi:uncharacterized membrane protein